MTDLIHNHAAFTPADGIPDLDVDPYDLDVLLSPFDFYRRLRDAGPVVHLPQYNVLAVGRYAETRAVFVDHENFVSSRGVGLDDFDLVQPFRPPSIILEVDPPLHSRNRKPLAMAMSRSVTADLRPQFVATAEAIIDSLPDGEVFDAATRIARDFPATAFPAAVGMVDVDQQKLLDYSSLVFNSVGPDNELRRAAMAQAGDIVPWVAQACQRERLLPGGLGATVYECADEGMITEEEAGLLVRSLLTAGVDTTVGGIAALLFHLGSQPDVWGRLQADRSLVKPCVEETLRLESNVSAFARTAVRDTEIAGFPVAAGTKVLCVLGAANTDPTRWGDDADHFRLDRNPTGHLAFGAGVHICVGHAVAREEMMVVLEVMLDRLASFELAGEAEWRPNNSLRNMSSLPARISRA